MYPSFGTATSHSCFPGARATLWVTPLDPFLPPFSICMVLAPPVCPAGWHRGSGGLPVPVSSLLAYGLCFRVAEVSVGRGTGLNQRLCVCDSSCLCGPAFGKYWKPLQDALPMPLGHLLPENEFLCGTHSLPPCFSAGASGQGALILCSHVQTQMYPMLPLFA